MEENKKIISVGTLEIFKDNMDSEIDEKINQVRSNSYTLSKNEDNEIVLTSSDGSSTKVEDSNTTYTFSEENHILTITGSDGTSKEINLGDEITKETIIEALGFTPVELGDTDDTAYPGDKGKKNEENIEILNEYTSSNSISYELDVTGTGITIKGGLLVPLKPTNVLDEEVDDIFSDITTDSVTDEDITEVLS